MSKSITDTLARSLFQRGLITADDQVVYVGQDLLEERTIKALLARVGCLFVAHVASELYYGTFIGMSGSANDSDRYSIVLSQQQVVRVAEIDRMYRVVLKRCPAILSPPQSPLKTVIDADHFVLEEQEYFVPGGRYLYVYDVSTFDVPLVSALLGALEDGVAVKVLAVCGGAEVKELCEKLGRYKGKSVAIFPIVSNQHLTAFLSEYRTAYVNV